ncbi:MAG TPA: hypothetical protein PKY25_00855, partial [Bacilli bacterium]|nr:hypothetical protein [Bacilli bacterium]
MKKYNLIKVLGITLLVTWLLTFIIPTSTISEGITRGSVTPFGIWNLLLNALVSVTYFNTLGLYIIVIAVFYGLLELIKQYNDICDSIAKGFKDKKRIALVISILFFSLLALVVADPLSLLVFVPFFWKILSKLEIDKKHIVLATIISIFVGSIGLIYNSTVANNFSSTGVLLATTNMLPIFILGVLSIGALIIFTIMNTKKINKAKIKFEKDTKEVIKDPIKVKKIPYLILTMLFGCVGINKIYTKEYGKAIAALLFSITLIPAVLSIVDFILQILNKADKKGYIVINSKKRNSILFIVGAAIVTLFILTSTIAWETLFKTTAFTDFNTWFYGLKINEYLSMKSLIGSTEVIGTWSFGGLSVLLII